MGVVTINARLLHNARLGVAHDRLTVDLGEVMNRLLPVGLPQMQQRLALEVIVSDPFPISIPVSVRESVKA
jgi:hypothetical protein